ncbi:erythroblast NAD(P)(+)--arginine ADP-ribosyltransferase-like [Colossoma macropomum]|uniref:erythroblast NAD(P)(+)--arginine ADP-ribosyltransferase-like n=1 Tax=Colossoma macropomum TaxID=42526 RepID=UPI001863CC54|nr:erythroblast NAD(P)(+)--arginine ADP-ribosyltransferase-like [Colossoma macropomum]
MKMLNSTAMMRLFILLILVVHTASVMKIFSKAAERTNREGHQGTGNEINMDEYPNSIDDEFKGCKEKMHELIKPKLEIELQSNENFSTAWTESKVALNLTHKSNSDLTAEELRDVALLTYTGKYIHGDLNNKMRNGKDKYLTEFGLISLHFLITDGIQTRNAEQHPRRTCQTAYRRTEVAFDLTETFVRFGSFASSSLSTLQEFGTKTCFIITTCYGADISEISMFGYEAEVLIPPYERFVKDPVTDIPPGFSECERVYKLRSVGKKSNMKCEYIKVNAQGCFSG